MFVECAVPASQLDSGNLCGVRRLPRASPSIWDGWSATAREAAIARPVSSDRGSEINSVHRKLMPGYETVTAVLIGRRLAGQKMSQ